MKDNTKDIGFFMAIAAMLDYERQQEQAKETHEKEFANNEIDK